MSTQLNIFGLILRKKIRQRKSKNIEELEKIIREEWEQISPDFCKKLVFSMLVV
jgi:hypothetical protein